MRGDNDANLKWPFRGTIKVSMLNQLEDGQHLTRLLWSPNEDVSDDCCGGVTRNNRASTGWGNTKFISYEDLKDCDRKKCHFFKDDTLFFREIALNKNWTEAYIHTSVDPLHSVHCAKLQYTSYINAWRMAVTIKMCNLAVIVIYYYAC